MSISVICDKCLRTLDEAGGLAFSPPQNGICKKYHFCVSCFKKLFETMVEPLNVEDSKASDKKVKKKGRVSSQERHRKASRRLFRSL